MSNYNSLSNNYHLRTTKDSKFCFVCGKTSNFVLDAPDDFFFVCLSHTKDSGFCTMIGEVIETDVEIVKMNTENTELKGNEKLTESKLSLPLPADVASGNVCTYKLHRSILFLRVQEKAKREKMNLLRKLK